MIVAGSSVHGLTKALHQGPTESRVFAEMLLKHIGDVQVSIKRFIEDGDWASILMHVSAKNRSTGADVTFDGLAMVRVEGDKLTVGYNYIDFIGLFEQLGLMQDGSLATCLCAPSAAYHARLTNSL